MIDDGNDIPITHVGSIILDSSTTIFSLDNVLCAPLIKNKKNILFVYQFCNQNKLLLNFFLDFFTVKDFSRIISYFGVLPTVLYSHNKWVSHHFFHFETKQY